MIQKKTDIEKNKVWRRNLKNSLEGNSCNVGRGSHEEEKSYAKGYESLSYTTQKSFYLLN